MIYGACCALTQPLPRHESEGAHVGSLRKKSAPRSLPNADGIVANSGQDQKGRTKSITTYSCLGFYMSQAKVWASEVLSPGPARSACQRLEQPCGLDACHECGHKSDQGATVSDGERCVRVLLASKRARSRVRLQRVSVQGRFDV